MEATVGLAETIYERWLAEPRLLALAPAERVFTGRAAGECRRPYAVITGLGVQPACRTTHSAIDSARLEIAAWVEEHALARRLLDQLRQTFDRQAFAVEQDRCLMMQLDDERITAEADQGWRAVAVFHALCERAAPGPP